MKPSKIQNSASCAIPQPQVKDRGKRQNFTSSGKWGEILGADLRSLAAFRIGIALVVLVDLLIRSTDLRTFYTDSGVLPRSALLEKFLNPWILSFHLINGTFFIQSLLFMLAGLFTLGLLLGYRTRIMSILAWAFLISLHGRNPIVLQAGDALMRMMLFWGMFLPWGACYSIDSALDISDEELPRRVFSMGTLALFLQVVFLYLYSVSYKWHGAEWHEGTAVYYALSIDQFATPFGHFLLGFPLLLKVLTHAVLWFETIGPLLLFSPFFIGISRLVMVLAFVGMHLGLRSCLQLGPFPFVSSVAMLPFLPTWFWEKIFSRLATPARLGLKIYYDGDCGFCLKSVRILRTFLLLSKTPILAAQSDPSIFADLQEKNSWVVVDHKGNRHFRSE